MGQPDVCVVGAGIVGLSCAWFLQEEGARVTVLDQGEVNSGASWGNAGWISPALAVPLPDPSVLRYGLRMVFDRHHPVKVPTRFDPDLWRFLARFARACTTGRWHRGMAAMRALNGEAFSAYDDLLDGGVVAATVEAPVVAAFQTERAARSLFDELRLVTAAGQQVAVELLTGDEAKARVPVLPAGTRLAVAIEQQRFINPPGFVEALATSVCDRGGQIRTQHGVRGVVPSAGGVAVKYHEGPPETFGAVVLASGAWLPELAAAHGVRTLVQGGRGYSFSVEIDPLPAGPVYFPAERVACTPVAGRLRIGGLMEFDRPDEPLRDRRIESLQRSAMRMLDGPDWGSCKDEWVGARPVTTDGLPLIGRTRSPGVYVAGGHGMWGVTLGPATGRLIARQVIAGISPPELIPFDPCR